MHKICRYLLFNSTITPCPKLQQNGFLLKEKNHNHMHNHNSSPCLTEGRGGKAAKIMKIRLVCRSAQN